MAYTKGDLVRAALNELGMADYEFDITPEELSSGVRRLDGMMAAWSDMNLHLSYDTGGSSEDSSGIPSVAWEAVISNLACKLAPSYGKQVAPEVRMTAKASLNTLLSTSTVPRQAQFQTMPRGAGYKSVDRRFTAPPEDRYLEPVDDGVDISGGPDGA